VVEVSRENGAKRNDLDERKPGAAEQAAEQLPFVKRRKTGQQSLYTISHLLFNICQRILRWWGASSRPKTVELSTIST
jgi:hypothetical protein